MSRARRRLPSFCALLCLAVAVPGAGCRGRSFRRAPFHLVGDMDWQPKYKPEGESAFFGDRRAMRPPVEGTVARGQLREDTAYWTGRQPGSAAYLSRVPVPVTRGLVERGRQRFDIFCAPCHDRTGGGHGMVALRGFQPPPTNLADDRVRAMPDGQMFEAVSRGVRNMPSYAWQVPVEDRWAIVSWVRVLQRSQHAAISDVPANLRDAIEGDVAGGAR